MKKFKDYIKEQEIIQTPLQPRKTLTDVIGFVSALEPKDIADSKDKIIELKQILDEILAGSR